MGIGSTYAVEVEEQRYLEAKEAWIREKLGDSSADEYSPGWTELAEEYDRQASEAAANAEELHEAEMWRRGAIRDLVQEFQIPYLVHFTQINNLESIISHGLLSRLRIGENASINDENRLDRRLDTISTSIAFPNYKMFYKYRVEKGGAWCVIGLDSSVLWELDCLFCKHNAATPIISGMPDEVLSSPESLRGMYEELDNFESRQEQRLKVYDPTDVQAEILVRGHIPARFIRYIAFSDKPSKDKYEKIADGLRLYQYNRGKGLFASRGYIRR